MAAPQAGGRRGDHRRTVAVPIPSFPSNCWPVIDSFCATLRYVDLMCIKHLANRHGAVLCPSRSKVIGQDLLLNSKVEMGRVAIASLSLSRIITSYLQLLEKPL